MGILKRFGDIMSSNINALLDKCEDPSKMIDQTLRNLESDLGKVKAETASVMADAAAAKRKLDECNEEIDKMQNYAQKALAAGNESDARKFLEKKQQLTAKQKGLQEAYDAAQANADKMRQMHDKLERDIATLNERRDAIKAKVQVAKTQEHMNQMMRSVDGSADNMAAFDKWEAKADKMLDKANAMSELNADTDSVDALAAKYDTPASDTSVDDELAALKAQMGL
jgi:phage shock protein A